MSQGIGFSKGGKFADQPVPDYNPSSDFVIYTADQVTVSGIGNTNDTTVDRVILKADFFWSGSIYNDGTVVLTVAFVKWDRSIGTKMLYPGRSFAFLNLPIQAITLKGGGGQYSILATGWKPKTRLDFIHAFINSRLIDPMQGVLESNVSGNLRISLWQGVQEAIITTASDGYSNTNNGLLVDNYPYVYNGTTWDRVRASNIFKTVDVSAVGNTTLWTPAAGKKFRVIKIFIAIDAVAVLAVAGSELITFNDSGVAIGIGTRNFIPAAAGTLQGQDAYIVLDLGPNGYLSSAVNNVLQVNLGTALSAGNIRVTAAGTEE